MTRLTESIVCFGIISAMAAVAFIPTSGMSGSWGVTPSAEVRKVIDAHLAAASARDESRGIASRRLLRVSAPKIIRDARIHQNIQAVKAEFVEEYEPGISFGGDLQPRRYTLVIGFDDGKPLHVYYLGQGPKEYREAF